MAATIDEISGGRFVLGVGSGWNRDGGGERPGARNAVPHGEPPGHLAALGVAGADEAILVLDPITEGSVERVAPALQQQTAGTP